MLFLHCLDGCNCLITSVMRQKYYSKSDQFQKYMQSLSNSSSGAVAKGEVMCFTEKASVPRLNQRSYTIKEVLLHWRHKVATNAPIIVLYQVERKKK